MEDKFFEKKNMLNAITSALKDVQGVAAVVLGGSHAAGYANEKSDVDIGLYYFDKDPFEIENIRNIANGFTIEELPTVTGFYEWGPWVNGGAWITTEVGKVDILYRNIDKVQQTITDAINGIWHHNFDQQPPYGFRSIIYLGETQICKPLFDPGNVIQKLKEQILSYPGKLKETILADCLWMAEFTLTQCYYFANARDVYNTVGCFTRIANYLVHALFAINEIYPLGDKRAMQLIKTFNKTTGLDIEEIMAKVLGQAGTQARELITNTDLLKTLWYQVTALTDGQYKPGFTIE